MVCIYVLFIILINSDPNLYCLCTYCTQCTLPACTLPACTHICSSVEIRTLMGNYDKLCSTQVHIHTHMHTPLIHTYTRAHTQSACMREDKHRGYIWARKPSIVHAHNAARFAYIHKCTRRYTWLTSISTSHCQPRVHSPSTRFLPLVPHD